MPELSLAPRSACAAQELDIERDDHFDEAIPAPTGETPTAKRQRRLTLTAMTGLICELAQVPTPREPPAEFGEERSHESTVGSASEKDGPNDCLQHPQRESSPMKRLKRARASISATATADVMAAQAARTLTSSSAPGLDARSRALRSTLSSESSDSTEEEDESLAMRVRRAQAFEYGTMAATELASPGSQMSPGGQKAELSPRSQALFARGQRAAEIAAKVAASMMPGRATESS